MEAKELRVGNYVDWNGEKGIISQILEKEVSFNCGEEALIIEVNPLKLTSKWMDKFSFSNKNYVWTLEDICFFDYNYNKGELILKLNSFDVRSITIKYVHQLQNLYFSLTGKELTIKKPTY